MNDLASDCRLDPNASFCNGSSMLHERAERLLWDDAYKSGGNGGPSDQRPGIENKSAGDGTVEGNPINFDLSALYPKQYFSGPYAEGANDLVGVVEKDMTKLIPEADRKAVASLIVAIGTRDEKALGEVLRNASGAPEKLKDMVDYINEHMETHRFPIRLDVTTDGKVMVSDPYQESAVAFDPASGKAQVKKVEHSLDGSILIKPGEVVNADVHKVFSKLGDGVTTESHSGLHSICSGWNPNPDAADEPMSLPDVDEQTVAPAQGVIRPDHAPAVAPDRSFSRPELDLPASPRIPYLVQDYDAVLKHQFR